MGTRPQISEKAFWLFLFLAGSCLSRAIDTDNDIEYNRHERRRKRQYEQRQRRIQRRQNDSHYVTILQDTPMYRRNYESGRTYDRLRSNYANHHPTADAASPLTPSSPQKVYVQFNLGGTYMVRAVNEGNPEVVSEIGPFPVYDYTPAEQAEILERLRADFNGFPVEFVTSPPSPPFATIDINANTFMEVIVDNDNNILMYSAVMFGEADHIDFMNQIQNDRATVDANFWSLLVLQGDFDIFYGFAGLDMNTVPEDRALSQVMVVSTSNTAAHELGHLLGLRHLDSIGAPGDGVNTAVSEAPLRFVPEYPGPFLADETHDHLLASGASVGLTFDIAARVNRFFSERSALKLALAFSTDYPRLSESQFSPPVQLSDIYIPNTIVTGDNAGDGPLEIQTLIVEGAISTVDEVDTFLFSLEGNRVLTAEVVSFVDPTTFDDVVTRLQLYQEQTDGTYVLIRESFQEIESFDPILLDVPIAATGNYQIWVDAPPTVYTDGSGLLFPGTTPTSLSELGRTDLLTGNYQLLLYSYAVPLESGTGAPETRAPSMAPTTTAPVLQSPPTQSPVRATRPPLPLSPPQPSAPPIPSPSTTVMLSPRPPKPIRPPSYRRPLQPLIPNYRTPVSKGKGYFIPFNGKGRNSFVWKKLKMGKMNMSKMNSSKIKSYRMKSNKMKAYKMKSYKGKESPWKKSSKKGKNQRQYLHYYGSSPFYYRSDQPYEGARPSYYRPEPSSYQGGSPSFKKTNPKPNMTKMTSYSRPPGLSVYNNKMSYTPDNASANHKKPNHSVPSSSGTFGKKLDRGGESPFKYDQRAELPKPYVFYGGQGKGNKGIDVFVF